jgi:hypothetical protein
MATGMLDALFATKQKDLLAEERAEDQRLQFQASDPFKAAALATYEGGAMAGRGLGRTAAVAMGRDPRTSAERQAGSIEKAKAEIAAMGEIDFSTPEGVDKYYLGVINILRKNNLPGEAHAASVEWNKHKNEKADRDLKADEIARKKAADAEKAKTEQAKVAAAAERNRLLAQRGMGEFVGWIDRIEKTQDPRTKQLLIDRANAAIAKDNRAGRKITLENAGDRVIVRDETGAVLGTDMMGEKPLTGKEREKADGATQEAANAYRELKANLQAAYDAAVSLYNHPGLPKIFGPRRGRYVGEDKDHPILGTFASVTADDEAGAALALYRRVAGITFLEGLQTLKRASKTSSTGLGAVSEKEGDKVQAAAVAIDRMQQAPDARNQLQKYLAELVALGDRLDLRAEEDNVPVVPLQEKQLVVPRGQQGRVTEPSPTPAAPRAPRQPAQSAQPAAGTVRLYHPKTKKPWNIKPDQVDEAKRRGFTETQ